MVVNMADNTPSTTDDLQLRMLAEGFYLQALDQVTHAGMGGPSRLPGWTRKHVAMHVIANADAFMRLIEWARTGNENPMYPSRAARDAEIEQLVASTPDGDVSTMAHEASEELTQALNTMNDDAWSVLVRTGQGEETAASFIPWARARECFVHALDLNIGYTALDFPTAAADRIFAELLGYWKKTETRANFLFHVTDREDLTEWRIDIPGTEKNETDYSQPVEVTGEFNELLQYAIGRGWPASGRQDNAKGGAGAATPEDLPTPPPWV